MRSARLLLASRSAGKIREIRQILAPRQVLSLAELGVAWSPAEDDVESHATFRENAIAKARHFAAFLGECVIADDSGIEVSALGGQPGVRSRRFAARDGLTGEALDAANNALLLERLREERDSREARYVCAAVLFDPNSGRTCTALGTVRGLILEEPRGTGGFGYDPLFWLPEAGCSFGELPAAQKHRFSHRARAFRALAGAL